MNPTIYLDMDGVLVDLENALARVYQDVSGGDVPQWVRRTRRKWAAVAPDRAAAAAMSAAMESQAFWEALEPASPRIGSVIDSWLHDGIDVRIATTLVRGSEGPCAAGKIAWIREHVPAIGVRHTVFTADKGRLVGDALVDDRIANLVGFRDNNPGARVFTVVHLYTGAVPPGIITIPGEPDGGYRVCPDYVRAWEELAWRVPDALLGTSA